MYGVGRAIVVVAAAWGTTRGLIRGSLTVRSPTSMSGLFRYADAPQPARLRTSLSGGHAVWRMLSGSYSPGFARLTRMTDLQKMGATLAKFRVIPGECPVGGSQLMIICPYPFCDASWKRGLGRPVGPCSSDRC